MPVNTAAKGEFSGNVVDRFGKPVPDAFIRANQGPKRADGVSITTNWTETHSDASGRYRLRLQKDTYDLQVTSPAVVRGRVLDAHDQPVANREVRAAASDLRDNRYYDPTTRTRADGSFELKFIRPGKNHVQIAPFWLHPEQAPAGSNQDVELEEGKTVELPDFTATERS